MQHERLTQRLDHAEDPTGSVAEAARLLRAGELVAIPTETVYGLAVDALDEEAVAAVFTAKGRPSTDPLIVHLHDTAELGVVVREWPETAARLAEAFWPGPLTIVAPRDFALPGMLSAGGDAIAVRIPAHPVAEAVLAAFGGPVAAPSANRFGRVSPTTADHVIDELGGRIAAVLDAGPTHLGIESTVLDVTGGRPRVLRPGGVTVEMLREVIGPVDFTDRQVDDDAAAMASPGRSVAHYSPATPLVLVDGGAEVVDLLLAALSASGLRAAAFGAAERAEDAARELYGRLRSLDRSDAEIALAVPLDPAGLGRAVNDRLFRAARGRVVLDATPETVDRVVAIAREGA